jgi:DNA-binding GntR family transcriptional regulator
VLSGMGGNRQIAALAERVHRQIQGVRVRCAVQLPGRPLRSHTEHLAIADAVRDGDAERAEALLRAHIQSVREAVVAVLRQATQVEDRTA